MELSNIIASSSVREHQPAEENTKLKWHKLIRRRMQSSTSSREPLSIRHPNLQKAFYLKSQSKHRINLTSVLLTKEDEWNDIRSQMPNITAYTQKSFIGNSVVIKTYSPSLRTLHSFSRKPIKIHRKTKEQTSPWAGYSTILKRKRTYSKKKKRKVPYSFKHNRKDFNHLSLP